MERVRRDGRGRKVERAGSDRRVAVASDGDGFVPSQPAGWRTRRQSRIRKEPATQRSTFVGLAVHKRWINVAVLLPGHDTAIEWRICNEPRAIRRMLKRISGLGLQSDVRYCYEAGPCGYALQRQIIGWSDASCMLVAPSLVPRKPC